MGFPGGSAVKNPPASTGDADSIPGLGRSPGEGNGNPIQYSCLGNPMARGDLQAMVHEVTKSWTQLSMHTSPDIARHCLLGVDYPKLGTTAVNVRFIPRLPQVLSIRA